MGREREEGPDRAPVEPAKKGSVGLSDPRLSGSVSESLIQLGIHMHQLSMAVVDLQARADVQTKEQRVEPSAISWCLPRWPQVLRRRRWNPRCVGGP